MVTRFQFVPGAAWFLVASALGLAVKLVQPVYQGLFPQR
jgi:hypothetical protein